MQIEWIEDHDLQNAPKDWPIQVHRDGWSKPRCAKWHDGWWIDGQPYHLTLHRWAPMLPLPEPKQGKLF